MPERDYGLADIVQRSGTARAGLLRDLGQAQAQNRLALGAAQAQGYQDQGQRSALLAGSLAKIVGGAVDDYQTGQKIKIAQQAEARKAAADEAAALRDQTKTDIEAQKLALTQHEADLKHQKDATELLVNMGESVKKNPDLWPHALKAAEAIAPGISKQYDLTQEFDPAKLDLVIKAGTDHKDQIEQEKLVVEQRKLLDAEQGPTAINDQLKNMAGYVMLGKTPEDRAARAQVIQGWKVSEQHQPAFNEALARFNASDKTPEALRALALTPEQNVQADQNAETAKRLDAAAVETARHNKATEQNAAERMRLSAGGTQDPETIAGWVRYVQRNGSFADVPAAQGMKNAVMKAMRDQGMDVAKLTAADLTRKNVAKTIEPKIDDVRQMAEQINKLGLMGTVGGRWQKLVSGESAATALAGLTHEQQQLVGKFATEAKGLLKSGIAMAHGGARGGGSPQLLEMISSYLDPGDKPIDVYIGNLEGAKSFMHGYATMGEDEQPKASAFPPKGTPRVVDGVAYVSDGTKFVKK